MLCPLFGFKENLLLSQMCKPPVNQLSVVCPHDNWYLSAADLWSCISPDTMKYKASQLPSTKNTLTIMKPNLKNVLCKVCVLQCWTWLTCKAYGLITQLNPSEILHSCSNKPVCMMTSFYILWIVANNFLFAT